MEKTVIGQLGLLTVSERASAGQLVSHVYGSQSEKDRNEKDRRNKNQ